MSILTSRVRIDRSVRRLLASHAIYVDPDTGTRMRGADPRRGAAAVGH